MKIHEMLYPQGTLNFRGRLLPLDVPVVMGILNITPDSFYDGGRYQDGACILRQTEKMLSEGATIIDIGGMSSRPGAAEVSEQVELERVLPAITDISRTFPEALISVDTVRSEVARQAIAAGAHMVNDISAGAWDGDMYETVAELGVPYCLMHMQGTPLTMQTAPRYGDVVPEILDFFIRQVGKLRALGVVDIIIDPGFGFGKTLEHNFQLLQQLHVFKLLDLPILAGLPGPTTNADSNPGFCTIIPCLILGSTSRVIIP